VTDLLWTPDTSRPWAFSFEVPFPPSTNHSHKEWVNKKTGRIMRVVTDELRAWRKVAWHDAALACGEAGWTCTPLGVKVIIGFEAFYPDARHRDLHNFHKEVMDALQFTVYTDDCWGLVEDIDFTIDRQDPRLRLYVRLKEERGL